MMGVVIGAVIGGLVVLAVGVLVYFLRRRNIAGEYGLTNDDPLILIISFVFSKE